jgi:hypothetical protein
MNPLVHGLTRDRRDLELDRPAGLLLLDEGAKSDPFAVRDVADLQCHEVAATQIAVDAQIEQRQLARSVMLLQLQAYGSR